MPLAAALAASALSCVALTPDQGLRDTHVQTRARDKRIHVLVHADAGVAFRVVHASSSTQVARRRQPSTRVGFLFAGPPQHSHLSTIDYTTALANHLLQPLNTYELGIFVTCDDDQAETWWNRTARILPEPFSELTEHVVGARDPFAHTDRRLITASWLQVGPLKELASAAVVAIGPALPSRSHTRFASPTRCSHFVCNVYYLQWGGHTHSCLQSECATRPRVHSFTCAHFVGLNDTPVRRPRAEHILADGGV